MGYALRPGLHFCLSEGRVVLLDLDADRYFALSDPVNNAFIALANEGAETTGLASLAPLIKRRILVRADRDDEQLTIKYAEAPTSELDRPRSPAPMALVGAALVSEAAAAWQTRKKPLMSIVTDIQRMRTSLDRHPKRRAAPELGLLVAASFRTDYLISRSDYCLRRSVALIYLMARYRMFPSLVIGVRARPFAAHCWVQVDGMILNDSFDRVRTYSPILVV